MAVFKCKMCGGALDVSENQSIITCDYCGANQTLPKSNDDAITSLFNRANTLRLKNEFDKAQEIYEKIISTGSTDPEAYWGNVLCKFGIEYVEDPATFKRVPTCHRTQLEPVLSDVDYIAVIEHADDSQKDIYEAEAKAIDELQKNILRIVDGEEPFDIFICYKETDEEGKRTQDSVIANDIYHQLTQEGFKVFYAAITLEDKLGQEYEPYIFSALNSAKIMLVVGTRPEFFNAVWVKNEWSRFLKIIKNERNKILIPCYKDMDAYDLPEEFSHLQAQDMGKIGFISDIVRGIKKIIGDNTHTAPTAPAASSVPSAPVAPKAPPINATSPEKLVDKALLLIEDGNKVKARELINKALDIQPKNAEAYLGLLLLEMNVKDISDLAKSTVPLSKSQNYQRAVRFGSDDLKKRLEGYDKAVAQNVVTKRYSDAVAVIEKLSENPESTVNVNGRISSLRSAESTLKSLGDYKNSAELLEECKSLIKPLLEIQEAQQKKKKIFIAICATVAVALIAAIVFFVSVIAPASQYDEAQKLSDEGKYQEAISAFEELGDYKDSSTQIIKNKYLIAEKYIGNKDFKTALKYYEQCVDFEDSSEKIKECQYQIAVAYIAAGNQDDANALLEKIKDYKDSASLIHYHSIIILEQKDATCTESGYKSYICESCGYSNTEQFSALGHDSSAATCTKDAICSRCDAKTASALGHTDGTVCDRCGKNTFETLYFSGTGAKMISGINLPKGNYMITCTYENTGSSGHIDIKFFYDSDSYDLVLNDSEHSGSNSEFFNGSVSNGYFQVSPKDGCSWTITIEAQ